jgi:hypothetical protein
MGNIRRGDSWRPAGDPSFFHERKYPPGESGRERCRFLLPIPEAPAQTWQPRLKSIQEKFCMPDPKRKMPRMHRVIAFSLVLAGLIAQFTAVEPTLAGGMTFLTADKAASGSTTSLSFWQGIDLQSNPAKKPTETPIPPPTNTPVPPPTNTPVPPPTNTPIPPPTNTPIPPPTNTPIPPPTTTRTPIATATRIIISTSTSLPPLTTPGTMRSLTPSLVSATQTATEGMELTVTASMPLPENTAFDTPPEPSPTSTQPVSIPVTGNSTSDGAQDSQSGLSLTSYLGILILGVVGIGGLFFGDHRFLASRQSEEDLTDGE